MSIFLPLVQRLFKARLGLHAFATMRLRSIFVLLFLFSITCQATEVDWKINKDRWTPSDERNYSDFVAQLGANGCNTVDKCMKSAANPYRATDPAVVSWHADCAEFPYFLRAYFAWKNGLPFSYVNAVKPAGSSSDLRYSSDGNLPTRRRDLVTPTNGAPPRGPQAINQMLSEMNSAMFRIDPRHDSQTLFSDFYSPGVTREAIHPGTMVYDPAGHVVTIYKIEDDGRLKYFDAHPDSSVSHSVYGEKFVRSRPGQGAGFKNWRPLILLDARQTGEGFVGGHVAAASNEKIPGYSTEQYFGNQPSPDGKWSKGTFTLPDRSGPVDYYDYVRTKLARGDLKYEPVEEMQNMLASLCQDIQDRILAVQTAVQKGIPNAAHPDRLPNNIYGTDGDWETYSTPSRDARLKTSFVEVLTSTRKYVDLFRQHDPHIKYEGSDLAGDLRRAYTATTAACQISYVNSAQKSVALTYDDVVSRLFAISFDPYHCPELRWGATGTELQSCLDSAQKRSWYAGEQRLRNQVERTYSARMSFNLDELLNRAAGSGVDQAPDVDLRAYLQNLAN